LAELATVMVSRSARGGLAFGSLLALAIAIAYAPTSSDTGRCRRLAAPISREETDEPGGRKPLSVRAYEASTLRYGVQG
jgi:hypothetical protein